VVDPQDTWSAVALPARSDLPPRRRQRLHRYHRHERCLRREGLGPSGQSFASAVSSTVASELAVSGSAAGISYRSAPRRRASSWIQSRMGGRGGVGEMPAVSTMGWWEGEDFLGLGFFDGILFPERNVCRSTCKISVEASLIV
jgi:hypothetical protein